MADDAVRIDVLLEDMDAKKGLSDLEARSKRTFRTFEAESKRGASAARAFSGALGGMRRAFGFVASLAGGLAIAATVRKSIDLFRTQEEAVQRVTGALAAQGITSKAVVRELEEYSSALQKITIYGDEAYLAGQSLALSMGATVDQAKSLSSAAADLAGALGVDLNTAVRMLGQSLSGQSLTLGRYLPEIRKYSAAELRGGAAIGFVQQRFGGIASTIADSEGGRYQQAMNAFGDQLERLGSTVLPVFATAIEGLNIAIEALTGQTEKAPLGAGERALGDLQVYQQRRIAAIGGLNTGLSGLGLQQFGTPTMSVEDRRTLRDVGENIDNLRGRLRDIDAYVGAQGTPDLQPWQNGYRPPDSDYMGPRMTSEQVSLRPKFAKDLAEAEKFLSDFTASYKSRVDDLPSMGAIEGMNSLVDEINRAKGSTESAKALFDAINAPTAEELYQQRLAGIGAGTSLYAAVNAGADRARGGIDPAVAEQAARLRTQAGMEFLAADSPALVQFHEEFKQGIAEATNGGLVTALRGGGVRGALMQFSQSLADSVSQALADALTQKLLGGLLSGGGGLDKALLSIFGPGGESGAGAGAE